MDVARHRELRRSVHVLLHRRGTRVRPGSGNSTVWWWATCWAASDSRRAWNPASIFGRHFLRARHRVSGPALATVVWRSFGDVVVAAVRRRLPPVSLHDERWPAHLHIDMLPGVRGRGVGATLVHRWFDTLRELGVPGCHLETLGENHNAIAFFESMGFHPPRRTNVRARPAVTRGDHHTVQLMVQSFGTPPVRGG